MEQRISLEDLKRRRIALGSVATLGGLAIAGASIPFIQSMQPSVRTLSEYPNAPVTVDVSDLAVGKGTIVTWRGEPFVIFRRSNEDIRALQDIGSSGNRVGDFGAF